MFESMWNPFASDTKTSATGPDKISSLEKTPDKIEKLAAAIGMSLDKIRSYLDSGKPFVLSPAVAKRAKIILPALLLLIAASADDASAQKLSVSGSSSPNGAVSQEQSEKNIKRQQRNQAKKAFFVLFTTATQSTAAISNNPNVDGIANTTQTIGTIIYNVDESIKRTNDQIHGTH